MRLIQIEERDRNISEQLKKEIETVTKKYETEKDKAEQLAIHFKEAQAQIVDLSEKLGSSSKDFDQKINNLQAEIYTLESKIKNSNSKEL